MQIPLRKGRPWIVAKPPITLEWRGTTFNPGETKEVTVHYNHKAWQCPLCKKWEEFVTLSLGSTEHVVKGLGGSSHFYMNGRVDHCSDISCNAKGNEILGIRDTRTRALTSRHAVRRVTSPAPRCPGGR